MSNFFFSWHSVQKNSTYVSWITVTNFNLFLQLLADIITLTFYTKNIKKNYRQKLIITKYC